MEVKLKNLPIFCLVGILIYPCDFTHANLLGVNITIGLPTLPTTTATPPQVPWTRQLPTCDLNVSDALLSNCIASVVDDIRKSWGAGIPSLGIPPMDPFTFDELHLNACSPTLDFEGNFTNINITGFNNLSNVRIGINGGNVSFEFVFPKLRLDGHYKACGRVVLSLFPINGEGPFWFEFYNMTFFGTTGLRNEGVSNVTILTAYDVKPDFSLNDYAFELKNLGGQMLGPAVNAVAYTGRGMILDSIKDALKQKNAELLADLFNNFLPTQPYLSGMLDPVRCSHQS